MDTPAAYDTDEQRLAQLLQQQGFRQDVVAWLQSIFKPIGAIPARLDLNRPWCIGWEQPTVEDVHPDTHSWVTVTPTSPFHIRIDWRRDVAMHWGPPVTGSLYVTGCGDWQALANAAIAYATKALGWVTE